MDKSAKDDFYPRPPRGGRLKNFPQKQKDPYISIHALREEGDNNYMSFGIFQKIFLSTPSARRATRKAGLFAFCRDISIPALREEGDTSGRVTVLSPLLISIHALREEGDRKFST